MNLEHCQDNTYEIGWTINRNYRNCGYATEAADALVKYAINNQNYVEKAAEMPI